MTLSEKYTTRAEARAERHHASLPRLLPYRDALDDVVVLSDNSMGFGFEVTGWYGDTLDDSTLQDLTSRFESIMLSLPEKLYFQILFFRHSDITAAVEEHEKLAETPPGSSQARRVGALLTKERAAWLRDLAAGGVLKADSIYLTITIPRSELERRWARREGTGESAAAAGWNALSYVLPGLAKLRQRTLRQHQLCLQEVAMVSDNIAGVFGSQGITCRRLRTPELVNLIYRQLNPARSAKHPHLHANPFDDLREQLCFSDLTMDKRDDESFHLGGTACRIISMKVLPETTFPAMLIPLLASDKSIDICLSCYIPDRLSSVDLLKAQQRRTSNLKFQKSGFGFVDLDHDASAKDKHMKAVIEKTLESGHKLLYVEFLITVRGRDEAETSAIAEQLIVRLRTLGGLESVIERFDGRRHIFRSTLPFHPMSFTLNEGQEVVGLRTRRTTSDHVADLAPFWTEWRGHPRPVTLFLNRRSGLTPFDPFHRDNPAHHGLVVASTGSGKTVNPESQTLTRRPGAGRAAVRAIKDVRIGDEILSVNMATGAYEWKVVTKRYDFHEPCFEITTRRNVLGMKHTPTHRFAVPRYGPGGIHLEYLATADAKPGDAVAIPLPAIDLDEGTPRDRELGYFLGALIGDGNYGRYRTLPGQVQLTAGNPQVARRFLAAASQLGLEWIERTKQGTDARAYCLRPTGVVRDLLAKLGVKEALSGGKELPSNGPGTRSYYRGLIEGLIDTDGYYATPKGQLSLATVSPALARQVLFVYQAVFGFYPNTRTRVTTYRRRGEKVKGQRSYEVILSGCDLDAFMDGFRISDARRAGYVRKPRNTNYDNLTPDLSAAVQDDLFDMGRSVGIWSSSRIGRGRGSIVCLRFADGTRWDRSDRFRNRGHGIGRRYLLDKVDRFLRTLDTDFDGYAQANALPRQACSLQLRYLHAIQVLTERNRARCANGPAETIAPTTIQLSDHIGREQQTVLVHLHRLAGLGLVSLDTAYLPRRHGEMFDMFTAALTDAGRAAVRDFAATQDAVRARLLRLRYFLTHYAVDRIETMVPAEADLCDLSVADNQNYVTEHSVAHNSYAVNYLILNALKLEPLLFIVDNNPPQVGGSYRKLVRMIGGEMYEFDMNQPVTINPFWTRQFTTVVPAEKLAMLTLMVERMLIEEGQQKLRRFQRAVVEKHIARTYAEYGDKGEVMLRHFIKVLAESDDAEAVQMSKALYPWTEGGTYAGFIDGPNQFRWGSRVVCFDLRGINAHPDLQSVILFLINHVLWEMIAENPHDPKIVVFDEVWTLLKGARHGLTYEADAVASAYRMLRKANGAAYAITQDIRDFLVCDETKSILANSINKFILQQSGDTHHLKELLNLTDKELLIVKSLEMVKGLYSECYLISNRDRGVVRVAATHREHLLATTDPDEAKAIDAELRAQGGNLTKTLDVLAERRREELSRRYRPGG